MSLFNVKCFTYSTEGKRAGRDGQENSLGERTRKHKTKNAKTKEAKMRLGQKQQTKFNEDRAQLK